MSTASANATALPAFHPSISPPTRRRGFLASLAALPLLGGNVAFMGRSADGGPEPSEEPEPDRIVDLDDYASASFEALEIDLEEVREAHRDMWTPLAVGLTLMTKSPDEMRDLAASLEDDIDTVNGMMGSLKNGAAWYRQAAEILESAEVRYLAGAARLIKEGQ